MGFFENLHLSYDVCCCEFCDSWKLKKMKKNDKKALFRKQDMLCLLICLCLILKAYVRDPLYFYLTANV